MVRLLVSLSMIGLALPAFAADTVKLAITGPFTGGSAPMGASMRDGAKLAIAEINASGGIPVGSVKMKIDVIERDDEAKNERGALIAQELAAMSDLSAVIGPELAAVANGRAKMGMTAPLIGGWTLSMSNFIDNAGKNGNGALMPQTFIEDPITPKAKAFIESYHKTYSVNRIPSAVSAAQGYDAVYLFAAAVKQAGSTDTHKIKDALEDLKEPVRGVIAVWKHPYTKWDPN